MDADLNLSIIVATAENEVIGVSGELPPWKLKADMQRFVKLTKGHMVLVGRKTHESILRRLGHELTDRKTVIITHRSDYKSRNCDVANSWEEAIKQARGQGEVFVIGGAEIYKLALPHTNTIYMTLVHESFEGDVLFPEHDTVEWEIISRETHRPDTNNSHGYTFLTTKRKRPAKTFVNLQHARFEKQRRMLEQIEKDGVCPFCPEHLSKYHENPIIKESRHWSITKNDHPYENTRIHLLAVLKTHAEELSELEPAAWQELLELVQWAVQEYKITGGVVGLRFGDTNTSGATVKHLHVHLITAKITDREDPDYKPVRFRVG